MSHGIQRLPNGVGTLPESHVHGTIWPLPYRPQWHIHLEDFDEYHSQLASVTPYIEDWVEFISGAGATTVQDAANGAVELATATGASDVIQIQHSFEDLDPHALHLNFTVGLMVPYNAGADPGWSGFNLYLGYAEQAANTNILTTPKDGYYFKILDSGTTLEMVVVASGIEHSVGSVEVELPVDEYFSLQFHHNEDEETYTFGMDGEVLGTMHTGELTFAAADTYFCMTAQMANTVGVGGEALIDFMWSGNERSYDS